MFRIDRSAKCKRDQLTGCLCLYSLFFGLDPLPVYVVADVSSVQSHLRQRLERQALSLSLSQRSPPYKPIAVNLLSVTKFLHACVKLGLSPTSCSFIPNDKKAIHAQLIFTIPGSSLSSHHTSHAHVTVRRNQPLPRPFHYSLLTPKTPCQTG